MRYALGLAVALVAVALRMAVDPALGHRFPFLFYFASTCFTAIFAGRGPAFLGIAVTSAGTAYFLMEPTYTLLVRDPVERLGLSLYIVVDACVAWLGGEYRALLARVEEQRAELTGRDARIEEEMAAQAEMLAALRLSEGRFGAFFNSAALGASINTPDGSFVLVNDAMCRLTGYAREELLARDCSSLTHPEDLPLMNQLIAALLAGKRSSFELEKRYVRKDGKVIWVLNTVALTPGAEGQPEQLAVICQDVTDRKALEGTLRHSLRAQRLLAKLGELGTAAPDRGAFLRTAAALVAEEFAVSRCGFSVVDAESGELRVEQEHHGGLLPLLGNPQMDGYTSPFREEGEAGRTVAIGDLAAEPRSAHVFASTLAELGVRACIAVPLARGGRWAASFWITDGEPRTWDVAEVEIMQLAADRLWASVRRFIAEEALLAAKEEAEAGSRAKDDFIASLSHELRTPLTPVLMVLPAWRDDRTLPSELQEDLAMMHRNISMEARLIDDLLDVTRIVSRKLPLKMERCNAHVLLSQALEIVSDDLRAKGIHLQFEPQSSHPEVEADPTRLQQVFWNVLKNAVKFTPKEGCVGVRARDEGDSLVVEVSDSGVGFLPEDSERIFQRFEQGQVSRQKRFGGLGLGLTICRAIIELHGGKISARSGGRDQGAVFTIEVPRSQKAVRETTGPVPAGEPMASA